MSNYEFGPALQGELDYRGDTLRRAAEEYRLARQARRARRAARSTRQPVPVRTPTVRPAPASPAEASSEPAGSVESPVARAA